MKPALATITLFFFLFTFSTKPSSVRADLPVPVVDTSGKDVTSSHSYYVLSVIPPFGGLSFATFDHIHCPHVVVQERFPVNGKKVKFSPLNPHDKVIHTSIDLNIEFSLKIPTCNDSGVWKITKFISGALNVATNGTAGSGQSKLNWFRIEKAEFPGAYKIMFYPNPHSIVREELGVFFHGGDGKRYVGHASGSQKLRVKFKKANVKNAIADVDEAVMSM